MKISGAKFAKINIKLKILDRRADDIRPYGNGGVIRARNNIREREDFLLKIAGKSQDRHKINRNGRAGSSGGFHLADGDGTEMIVPEDMPHFVKEYGFFGLR